MKMKTLPHCVPRISKALHSAYGRFSLFCLRNVHLVDGATWLKKTSANPVRGFTDDGEGVAQQRRTAAQKVTHSELMLGQIANFCPVIS